MKKYIYKLTLEDGKEFTYKFEGGISFNHETEDKEPVVSLITSAIFLECVDEDIVDESIEVELVV